MSTDFVSLPKQILEESNILLTPVNFVPVGMLATVCVDWVSVSHQEKSSWKIVLTENRNGTVELTP
jgi:hypothetical protein